MIISYNYYTGIFIPGFTSLTNRKWRFCWSQEVCKGSISYPEATWFAHYQYLFARSIREVLDRSHPGPWGRKNSFKKVYHIIFVTQAVTFSIILLFNQLVFLFRFPPLELIIPLLKSTGFTLQSVNSHIYPYLHKPEAINDPDGPFSEKWRKFDRWLLICRFCCSSSIIMDALAKHRYINHCTGSIWNNYNCTYRIIVFFFFFTTIIAVRGHCAHGKSWRRLRLSGGPIRRSMSTLNRGTKPFIKLGKRLPAFLLKTE